MHPVKARKHKRVMPDNTIALINVVFLMLIFFLIAGTVAPSVSPGLRPPGAPDLPQIAPAANAVEILADGSLIHRGEMLPLDAVLARFPPPGAGRESEAIQHILADRGLSARQLMPIMLAFRAAGHKSIRLVTLREAG
ncbi:biopolymer transporter ExbD [uncultured Cohaesibacter sp.]|uniref:ExbD/TolR family protein n=1 Tax=uncultured Cohaesibacter sp. TaxID=1002546 RepID=UPI0029C8F6FF|nr:biopolymer transporter ExbD [uncultured Cohaesibacter sp.]